MAYIGKPFLNVPVNTFAGSSTFAGVTLSSGALTFADGTSQSTAATTQGFAIAVAVALG